MDKIKRRQYISIFVLAIMLAFFSVLLADSKLTSFVSTDLYRINGRDLLNIIFMTDEFTIYPYC